MSITAKSKKLIQAKETKTSRIKNLNSSGTFFTSKTRQAFTKLKEVFVEVAILN